MTTLLEDLRYSLRMLVKGKGTTIAAVLTLALGIGATTALFSVTTTVLSRPLPYPEADRLAVLWQHTSQVDQVSVNRMDFADWREENTLFEEMTLYRGRSLNLTGEGTAERLRSLETTSGMFKTLGIQPILGRPFGPESDGPEAEREVILSQGLWQSRYGGDVNVLGREIRLNNEMYTVIGVLPEEIATETLKWYGTGDVWIPFGLTLKNLPPNRGYGAGHLSVARLKPGVTLEAAQAELDSLAEAQAALYPDSNTGKSIVISTLREEEVGEIRPALLTAFFAVVFLLLIACANVANLQLARAAQRSREMTIRTALGAGRRRLVRQLLTESLLLSLVGATLGTPLAVWGVKILANTIPESSPLQPEQVTLQVGALAFAFVVATVTGIVFGLLPALSASRTDVREALVDSGGRSATGSRRRRGLSRAFVIAEVALSLVLLIGASLMVRSLMNLQAVSPGFEPESVLTFRVPLPDAKYAEQERWTPFYDQLVEHASALPGVRSAAVSNLLPLISGSSESIVIAEGAPMPEGPEDFVATLNQAVSRDYFKSLGINLLQGRLFNATDTGAAPQVAIIDETMAQTLWPGEDPIGKRLAFEFQRRDIQDLGPIYREVVGVVSHVRHYRLDQDSRVEVYVPMHQPPFGWTTAPAMWGVIKTSGDPMALAAPLRELVRELDPELPIYALQDMETAVSAHWAQSQMLSRILGAFAVAALLLAIIGLYGVIADSVSRRTHEFGIRMALGAGRRRVLRMVIRQGVALALGGVLIGAFSAWVGTRLLASQLFEVPARDPFLFSALALFLLFVAAAATLIPALRATRVHPMVALRYE